MYSTFRYLIINLERVKLDEMTRQSAKNFGVCSVFFIYVICVFLEYDILDSTFSNNFLY